jgi:hypothetical protein
MATIVVGADLAAFQALTAPRRAEITDQVVAPLDQLADAVRGAQQDLADLQTQYVAAQAEQWDRYRQGYEQLLQDDPDAAVGPTDETSSRQIWNPAKRIATGSVAALPATDDEVELDRAEPHDGAPAPDGEVA